MDSEAREVIVEPSEVILDTVPLQPPALEVSHLVQEFPVHGRTGIGRSVVHAVSDVSFTVGERETVGIVGETGSGKSTLARSIIQSPRPKSGEVLLRGVDLTKLSGKALRDERRRIQMVFQDPFSSLDPKFPLAKSVEEPLVGRTEFPKAKRRARVAEMLELVGLDPALYRNRRPRQLSGGQAQRVAIARALSISPALIICDEAVSALDVLVQAQILRLLDTLQAEVGVSYLFISHDLAVVKQVSDRVGVMYLGKLCELGGTEDLYRTPLHPYTSALLAANPSIDPTAKRANRDRLPVAGEPPSPINPPSGCRFRTNCPYAAERCESEEPQLRTLLPGHAVACHFPLLPA